MPWVVFSAVPSVWDVPPDIQVGNPHSFKSLFRYDFTSEGLGQLP